MTRGKYNPIEDCVRACRVDIRSIEEKIVEIRESITWLRGNLKRIEKECRK